MGLAFGPSVRRLVALVGLAAAVYATASLTGGWLGTPPWWREEVPEPEVSQRVAALDEAARAEFAAERAAARAADAESFRHAYEQIVKDHEALETSYESTVEALKQASGHGWAHPPEERPAPPRVEMGAIPRAHRKAISLAVLLAGLGLLAGVGWPKRASVQARGPG